MATRYVVTGATRIEREQNAGRLRNRAVIAIGYAIIDWSVDPPELIFGWTLSTNEMALLATIPMGISSATVPMAGVQTAPGGAAGPHVHPELASDEELAAHAQAPHGGSGATLSTQTVGAAHSIDVGTTDHDLALTQPCTLSFTGTPASPAYLTVTLRGSFAATWPGAVSWLSSQPTGDPRVVVLYRPATIWYASSPSTHAHPFAADIHLHDYAPIHAHPYSGTAHNHDASYVHAHPYAATSHPHIDSDLPAGLARDAEVAATYAPIHSHPYEPSGAVSTHAGLADPHPGYLTPAEGNAAYAPTHAHPYEASGAVAAHAGLSDPHTGYATDADLATHAAGPHGGSGSTDILEAQIDFGTLPRSSGVFTVTDAAVTPSTQLLAYQSGTAATGKDADDNELDALLVRAVAGSGSFTVYADAMTGPVSGRFVIAYLRG